MCLKYNFPVFYTLVILFQMKLPANIGQKKTKAIEQVLEELNIGRR